MPTLRRPISEMSVGARSVRGLPIRFFMYEGRQLDHGYLRHCPGFEHMQHSAYNERLGEVYLRDSLAVHPWRTRSPSEATLFFVPIWEIVSFNVDECNGTTHKQRMAMAAAALLSAPSYRKPRLAKRPPGFDHLIASTGCIENGRRMAERLTSPLFRLLTSSIVGRDRACAIDRWRTREPCLLCLRMLTLVPLVLLFSAHARRLGLLCGKRCGPLHYRAALRLQSARPAGAALTGKNVRGRQRWYGRRWKEEEGLRQQCYLCHVHCNRRTCRQQQQQRRRRHQQWRGRRHRQRARRAAALAARVYRLAGRVLRAGQVDPSR